MSARSLHLNRTFTVSTLDFHHIKFIPPIKGKPAGQQRTARSLIFLLRLYDDPFCISVQFDFFNEQSNHFSAKPLAQAFGIANQVVYAVGTVLIRVPMPILSAVAVFVILTETDGEPLLISLYINSKRTINELALMQESNPEIMRHFAAYEDMILTALTSAVDSPSMNHKNLSEKMYLLYTLADTLGQEHAFHYHESVDLDVLRSQITDMMIHLFEAK